MRHSVLPLCLILVAGCGGEVAAAPPPAAPEPVALFLSPAPVVSAVPSTSASALPAPKPTMADMQRKWRAAEKVAWSAKDAKKLAALYSEDAEIVGFGADGRKTFKGRAELEAVRSKSFPMLAKTFPDMKWFDDRVLISGEVMVIEWISAGTDTGGMADQPATNKKVGMGGITLLWLDEDGLCKREHSYANTMTIRQQVMAGPKDKHRAPPTPPGGKTPWIAGTDSDAEKENLALATSIYPLIEKKDAKAFLALLDDGYVHVDQLAAEDVKGKPAAKKELAAFTKAFPDLKIAVTGAWAFGDLVVVETEMTGTFKGPLGSMKGTNKTGTLHGVDVVEIRHGKISKITTYGSATEMVAVFELPKPG